MKREACSPSVEALVRVESPPGAAILLVMDVFRPGSRTSLPACHMKRRSCHVGEDMMMAVKGRVVIVGAAMLEESERSNQPGSLGGEQYRRGVPLLGSSQSTVHLIYCRVLLISPLLPT